MKTVYELSCHWTYYGRMGGTPLDYDVTEGTDLVGRFETREAAAAEERRQWSLHVPDGPQSGTSGETLRQYEIKAVEVADE